MSRYFNQIRAFTCKKNLPLIPVNANHISIINEPESYFQTVLQMIENASRSLTISSLYIGTGNKEKEMMERICDVIQKNGDLDVNIFLDAHRAARIDNDGNSSCSLLDKTVKAGAKLNLINFKQDSRMMSRFSGRISKWNELYSTFHAKSIISDDDVLITGANLSSIYFERRHDRYLHLAKSEPLSHYMLELLKAVAIDLDIKSRLYSLNVEYARYLTQQCYHQDSDCFVIPLVQHGLSGIRDKEEFLQFLRSLLPSNANYYLASGYFNPSPTIKSINFKSILVPSEKANGFFGANGLLKLVPKIYTLIHEDYRKANPDCAIRNYSKPDWSFHAKGIWIEDVDDLYIHMMGSSNYNYRSSARDFEVQLMILTTNEDLKNRLQDERENLFLKSHYDNTSGRKNSSIILRIIAKLVRSYL